MRGRAATPTPSRSTTARSRCATRRLVPTIPIPGPRATIWPRSIRRKGAPPMPCRWWKERSRADARRCVWRSRCCLPRNANKSCRRKSLGRRPQRGSARRPVIGRYRREQAFGSPRRRKRSSRGAGSQGSGPHSRGGGVGQSDRCGGIQGAVEARRRGRAAGQGSACDYFPRACELAKDPCERIPDYAALSNPLPITAKEIAALLTGDEAMVVFSVVDKESYVFAFTREGFDWEPLPLGAEALTQKVAAFRRGLDVGKANDASGKSGLFDLAQAHELYAMLLRPVETLARDKRSLLVVPSGRPPALPFPLLVTEKPAAAIPETFDGYRDAAWLLKRQAVSVLPSVGSLKTLRVFARKDQGIKDQGIKPMTGFGDPLFNPAQEKSSGDKRGATKSASRSVTAAAYTDFWQGAGVDRGMLAQALPQLPDP